jgi:hypothetical protein
MHARDAGEFFHDLGTEFQHGVVGQVLDFWGVDDNTRKEFEMEEEVERRRWDKLHDQNAAIDAENAAHPNLPQKPHHDELTDEELAQIRDDVMNEHNRQQQRAGGAAQHAPGGAGPGHDAHTTAARRAQHTAGQTNAGAGHDTHTATAGTAQHTAGDTGAGAGHDAHAKGDTNAGTGTTATGETQGHPKTAGEYRRAMARDAGNWLAGGVLGDVAGIYGINRAALTAGSHQPGGTSGQSGGGSAHAGGAQGAAGAAHTGGDAAHGAGAEHGHDAHGAHSATGVGHAFADLQDDQVEELLRRIYPRLRTVLRTELLIDRERAGLLADFR